MRSGGGALDGSRIKAIGQAAREELEKLLGIRIFLELRVKVHPRMFG